MTHLALPVPFNRNFQQQTIKCLSFGGFANHLMQDRNLDLITSGLQQEGGSQRRPQTATAAAYAAEVGYAAALGGQGLC